MTELFRLAAKLVLDDDEFAEGIAGAKKEVGGLERAFSGTESGVTKLSSAMNVAKTVAGVAGTAIKKGFDIGKTLVESAASMSALDQSMAATFEGVEEEAAAAFAAVGEANNIAERRLQESGLAFYRQFLGAGMDSANAMVNMESALGLAADAAAAWDISLEDAAASMRSFIRGNTEAGEVLGIFVNQEQREILAQEEYGKKWKELTEAERQYLMLDLVGNTYKQNKVLGQGAREAYNYTNVVGNLQKAWEGAMASMGDSALPHVTTVLQALADWVNNNGDVFTTIGKWFGGIAEEAGEAALKILDLSDRLLDLERDSHMISDVVSPPQEDIDRLGKVGATFYNAGELLHAAGLDDNVQALVQGIGIDKAAWDDDLGAYVYTPFTKGYWDKAIPSMFAAMTAGEDAAIPFDVALQMGKDAQTDLQDELNGMKVYVPVIPWLDKLQRLAGQGGAPLADAIFWDTEWIPHARGLEYVPTDGYPALLHRGESVLTRVEAENWRAAQRGGGLVNADELAAKISVALAGQLQGIAVNIDGHTAGALLTPYVSKEQYKETWKRR